MKCGIQTNLTSAPTALSRSFPSGEQLASHLKCGDKVTNPPCSSWPGYEPDGFSLESGGTLWRKTIIILLLPEHRQSVYASHCHGGLKNKHLMTGLKGMMTFVSPRPSGVFIPPTSKIEQTVKKLFAWRQLAHKFAAVPRCTTWSRSDESSRYCFAQELVSFVHTRELVSFDPWHVTRSPPIGKRIWVWRCNNWAI